MGIGVSMDAVWTLSSSDGWNHVSGRALRHWADSSGETLLLFEISIRGQFWQRDADDLGDLRDDFECRLAQVIIGRSRLRELLAALNNWLSTPNPVRIELSGWSAQQLSISFDVSEDFICSMDSPVCEIRYTAERMSEARWNFVVDQSCIRSLHDDLIRVLHAFNGKG
jgi:hypothetical protein